MTNERAYNMYWYNVCDSSVNKDLCAECVSVMNGQVRTKVLDIAYNITSCIMQNKQLTIAVLYVCVWEYVITFSHESSSHSVGYMTSHLYTNNIM